MVKVNPVQFSNPYKFSAYRSAALNSSTSPTVVVFETELFDTNSNFSTSTGLYTAPVAGFYWFSALVGNTAATATLMVIQLNINGTLKHYGHVINPSNANNRHPGSWLVQMAANDTAGIAFTGGGGSVIGVGAENCWFQGFLMSTT